MIANVTLDKGKSLKGKSMHRESSVREKLTEQKTYLEIRRSLPVKCWLYYDDVLNHIRNGSDTLTQRNTSKEVVSRNPRQKRAKKRRVIQNMDGICLF